MSMGQVLEMELQRRPGYQDWLTSNPCSSPLSSVLLATVGLHWGLEGWSPDWEGWSPDLHTKQEQLSMADQGGAAPLPPVFAGHQF